MFQAYRDESSRKDLDGTIELLRQTSQLLDNYTSKSPITDVQDSRLSTNEKDLKWFATWNDTKVHPKAFFSPQTYEDLASMIRGTSAYVKMRLCETTSSSINLHRLNSDLIENVFSSQRGVLNGCNTNPTLLEYGKNINAIIICQNTFSLKKNNAAAMSITVGGAYPMKILSKQTFRRTGKRRN